MSAEDFLALPTKRPIGLHVWWREIIDGKWTVRYAGTSCSYPFQTASRAVIQVKAA